MIAAGGRNFVPEGPLTLWLLTKTGVSRIQLFLLCPRLERQLAGKFTWKTYFTWYEAWGFQPCRYAISHILIFLQSGVDQELVLSTVKGQISTLSETNCFTFFVWAVVQGIMHIVPPVKTQLTPLTLTLHFVLQNSPLEPIQDTPLVLLA